MFANRYVLELCANLDKDVKDSVDPIMLLGSVEKSLIRISKWESNIGRLKKHPYLVSARVNGVIGVVSRKGILTKRKADKLFVY